MPLHISEVNLFEVFWKDNKQEMGLFSVSTVKGKV